MAELLALDAQADENFRNAIGGTIFRTPEDFVEYFNSGLINRSFGEVKETASKLVDVYSNVKLHGNRIHFVSNEEAYIEKINEIFSRWIPVVRLKEAVRGLSGVVYILQSDPSVAHIRSDEGDSDVDSEKLFVDFSDAQVLFDSYSSYRGRELEEGMVIFSVSDIENIDTSFFERIYQIAPH